MAETEPVGSGVDASFAAAVRGYRESRGWTQSELAARMVEIGGVPDATQVLVSRIEAGKRAIRLTEAHALARVFGVSVEDMTAESEAARLLAVDHRRAREYFVRFREATAQVTRWQIKLREDAEIVRAEFDSSATSLSLLLQNVESFVSYDLAAEAQEVAQAVRAEYERNAESRGGRFVNVTKQRST